VQEAQLVQNVQNIFRWTEKFNQDLSSKDFDGLDAETDQSSSEEDEPLILTNSVRKGKSKREQNNLITGTVQRIHKTSEDLRSLVTKLKTKSMQNELDRWERSLERRERLRTPKTKNKVTYDPEVVMKTPIKLSPIVRLEEQTKKGKQELWRVQTPQPIFNESLVEAQLRNRKQKLEYSNMITNVRKNRRLNLYQSTYLEHGKFYQSPRGSASEAIRSLRTSSPPNNFSVPKNAFPAVVLKNKSGGKHTDDLYKRAWLLKQQTILSSKRS